MGGIRIVAPLCSNALLLRCGAPADIDNVATVDAMVAGMTIRTTEAPDAGPPPAGGDFPPVRRGRKPNMLTMEHRSKSTLKLDSPLEFYCTSNGISLFRAAEEIGVNYGTARRLWNGRGLPSLPVAFRMESWSKGGVPAVSWLGTEVGRAATTQCADWQRWRLKRAEEHRRNGKPRCKRYYQNAKTKNALAPDEPAEPSDSSNT